MHPAAPSRSTPLETRAGPHVFDRKPDVQAGFTLLETLVALTVLSLLVAGLTQGVRLGVSAWQTQTRGLAARGDLQATDALLRDLVARMDPGGAQPPSITGTAHSLAFTTTLPQAADALATREAEVTLAVDEAHRLALLWRPHYRNRIRTPLPEHTILLREVDRLDILYWKDARAGWLPEWTGPMLPRLVRIHIGFNAASGRRAPDIVAAPMRDRWRL